MLRPAARMGRLPTVVPRAGLRAGLVAGLALGMLVGLTGCGSDATAAKKSDAPSKAAQDCREQWKSLQKEVKGRDTKTDPSALAERWNSIAVAIDHYATSATGSDCGSTLSAERRSMATLTAFSAKLVPYDMQRRLEQVRDDAHAYATGPRPSAPEPSASKKGASKQGKKAKQNKPKPPPKPSDIAKALKTLTRQAPLATKQQGPAWQQARAVDLGNKAAAKKAVKDLAFLSKESAAYRSCRSALSQIKVALAAKQP